MDAIPLPKESKAQRNPQRLGSVAILTLLRRQISGLSSPWYIDRFVWIMAMKLKARAMLSCNHYIFFSLRGTKCAVLGRERSRATDASKDMNWGIFCRPCKSVISHTMCVVLSESAEREFCQLLGGKISCICNILFLNFLQFRFCAALERVCLHHYMRF